MVEPRLACCLITNSKTFGIWRIRMQKTRAMMGLSLRDHRVSCLIHEAATDVSIW